MAMMHASRAVVFFPLSEERFAAQSAARDADIAFARSRRRARLGLIRSVLGLEPLATLKGPPIKATELELPIATIAGSFLRGEGRPFSPLPRSLAPAWRLEYLRSEGREGGEPFVLRWSEGRWYLDGGIKERIRLEILWSRGEPSVRAILRPVAALARGLALEPEDCRELEGELAC